MKDLKHTWQDTAPQQGGYTGASVEAEGGVGEVNMGELTSPAANDFGLSNSYAQDQFAASRGYPAITDFPPDTTGPELGAVADATAAEGSVDPALPVEADEPLDPREAGSYLTNRGKIAP